ncbi:MAG: hypothetical protein A2V65_08570 [Deltaproteobacteria bacterium RBG_13_49_15]|nr:MAG: hypothetical protein A2V65_08570 [Deltaproteobacteria bacterium RBG_13_49_15]
MKTRSTLSFGIVAILLAAAVLFTGRFGRSGKEDPFTLQMAPVLPRSFDITVNTIGILDAADSQMVSSTVRGDKGKIIHIVEDGTRVESGDVLVRLDPTPFEEEVHRLSGEVKTLEAALDATRQVLEWEKNQTDREILASEFDLKIAQLELKKLLEGDGPIQLTQYREEMEKTREEFSRYKAYISELEALEKERTIQIGEVSLAREKLSELKEKFNNASLKFENYKKNVFPSLVESGNAKVQKAEMLIEQTRKGSVYRVAKAIASVNETQERLKTARTSLLRAQEELEKTTIRAPISGIAILHETFRDGQNRKPRVGDKVWQNQPLLYLPNISSMIVKTHVREVDLHKIALKQSCVLTVDAYPQDRFKGEVMVLGVLAAERMESGAGEKYFQLTIALTGSDSRLRPGMTVRVTIFNDRCKNVLSIPFAALFEELGSPYCYRKVDGGFQKIKIKYGRKNDEWVEILSGLHSGDQVALTQPPSEILKG